MPCDEEDHVGMEVWQRMGDEIRLLRDTIQRHHLVLNRLEPHLGCVVCRGPLTGGVCPTCDPELIDGDPRGD